MTHFDGSGGQISFLLALIRHIVLLIPMMLLMNTLWGLTGLIWSQLAADFLNVLIAMLLFNRVSQGDRSIDSHGGSMDLSP